MHFSLLGWIKWASIIQTCLLYTTINRKKHFLSIRPESFSCWWQREVGVECHFHKLRFKARNHCTKRFAINNKFRTSFLDLIFANLKCIGDSLNVIIREANLCQNLTSLCLAHINQPLATKLSVWYVKYCTIVLPNFCP